MLGKWGEPENAIAALAIGVQLAVGILGGQVAATEVPHHRIAFTPSSELAHQIVAVLPLPNEDGASVRLANVPQLEGSSVEAGVEMLVLPKGLFVAFGISGHQFALRHAVLTQIR